jgi:malate synthase
MSEAVAREPARADRGPAVRVTRRVPEDERVLTPAALAFVADLVRTFAARRDALLWRRRRVQSELDRGARLDFREDTRAVREEAWRIPPLPDELQKRVVEITGPVDKKTILNALSSSADGFMADFEDATAPSFANVIAGQANLHDAVRGTLSFVDEQSGKRYAMPARPCVLHVRPRGWHLDEEHVVIDGRPAPASLFDFGLFFFWNARALVANGTAPYFYLPKLEGFLEAKLWHDVIAHAERALDIAPGTVRTTVLIETLPAAFEMDEILHALGPYAAALNCGRWDYIFSYVKKHRADETRVLPDRDVVTMTQPFLRAYTQLAVKTCHRRGALAIGGMAAHIPQKDDEARDRIAKARVHDDKTREATDGHDGTWVAHPGLIPHARAAFDDVLRGRPNQLDVARDDVVVGASDLLHAPTGAITAAGLASNADVALRYLAAWLDGRGCVPIDGKMEDAATAEIARAQLWQWVHHRAHTDDGEVIDLRRVTRAIDDARARVGTTDLPVDDARTILLALTADPVLPEWLTVPAYKRLKERTR